MNTKSNITVCVIEDDEDVILVIAKLLENEPGLELTIERVREPKDLDSLPDRLTAKPHDVLLIDLGLPSNYSLDQRWQAGLDLLKALSDRRCQSIPIVLTAYDDDENRIMTARLGAPVFLVKKGLETWKTLASQVRRAHAYFLATQEQNSRQIKDVSARMAYDLKGPLAIFQLYMDLLLLGPGELSREQFLVLDRAIQDASEVSFLLDDIVANTRCDRLRANPKSISWPKLFAQIEHTVRLLIGQNSAVSRVAFINNCLEKVFLDEALVKRGIINTILGTLARSQSQHSTIEDVGVIEVESSIQDLWLTVLIRDSAPTFPDVHANKAHSSQERFSRDIIETVLSGSVDLEAPNEFGGTTTRLRFSLNPP